MKRSYVITMTLVLFLSIFMVNESVKAFSDLPNWAENEILYLNKEGIVSGLQDGTFGSSKTITRGDASLMLVRAKKLDITNMNKESSFPDVDKEMYYHRAIEAAVKAGYLSGYPDGRFGPKDTLTREQMAKIIADAYKLKGKSGYPFTDISKSWARREIELLARNGISSGTSKGKFNPKENITRAEFSVMLARVMNDDFKVDPPRDAFYVPSGAKLIEDTGDEQVYSYYKSLPGGGAINKVIGSSDSILMVGTDNNGKSMLPSYLPERDAINYTVFGSEKPAVNSDSLALLFEIGRDFSIGYGYGSPHPYHTIHIDIIGEQGLSWGASTDAKTFGELIDDYNKFNTKKIKLKETNGERVIHSFGGVENNDNYNWKVSSKGCKNGKCSQDVDLIKIDKDMEFKIIYVTPTLPSPVLDLLPQGATLIGETEGSATYSYNKNLPDGGSLKEVIVNKESRTIDIVGTHNIGAKLITSYNPATGGLTYNSDEYTLSTNDFFALIEVVQAFAKAYGMK